MDSNLAQLAVAFLSGGALGALFTASHERSERFRERKLKAGEDFVRTFAAADAALVEYTAIAQECHADLETFKAIAEAAGESSTRHQLAQSEDVNRLLRDSARFAGSVPTTEGYSEADARRFSDLAAPVLAALADADASHAADAQLLQDLVHARQRQMHITQRHGRAHTEAQRCLREMEASIPGLLIAFAEDSAGENKIGDLARSAHLSMLHALAAVGKALYTDTSPYESGEAKQRVAAAAVAVSKLANMVNRDVRRWWQ